MDIFSTGLWLFFVFCKYSVYVVIVLVWKIVWLLCGPFTVWLTMREPQNDKSFKANWKEANLLLLSAVTEEFLRFKISKDVSWYKYGENRYVNAKQTYGRVFAVIIDNNARPAAFRFSAAVKVWREWFLKYDFGWRLNRLDRGQKI